MKVALITGAGSGIGRRTAVEFDRHGYALVLAGRRGESLQATAAMCSGETEVVPCDVSDAASVEALFQRIRSRFGRVDVVFNNAGTNTPAQPIDELPADALREVIEVNLIGSILCAREAFALMKAQSPSGGRIINNGSVSAYGPRPHSVAYTASKHGITGLTKSLILDGRAHGINCSQIDIGNAASERTDRMEKGVLQANGTTAPEPRISLDLVAEAVVNLVALPPEANVPFMTIMASAMPLYGRG